MKKFLTFGFLLSACIAMGQAPQYIGTAKGVVNARGALKGDSALILGTRDTTNHPYRDSIGAITTQRGKVFLRDTVNANKYWKALNLYENRASFAELRKTFLPDIQTTYRVGDGEFLYDPADLVSADDSAMIIVTATGRRLKRVHNGIYRPEYFGAKGDGATDDALAFQRMFNYMGSDGGTVTLDRKIYKINSIVTFPNSNYKNASLIINGNGARILGNNIFRDTCSSNLVAGSNQTGILIIRDLNFRAANFETGKAVTIRARYMADIQNCSFMNYDSALTVRFALSTRDYRNNYLACKSGLAILIGDWADAGIATSQSNGTVSEGSRWYGTNNQGVAITVEAASDCVVRDFIIEGNALKHGIRFDSKSATVVKNFRLENGHIETANFSSYAIFFRGTGGRFDISNIFTQHADTIVVWPNVGTTLVTVSDMPNNVFKYGQMGSASAVTWQFRNPETFNYATNFVTAAPFFAPLNANLLTHSSLLGINTSFVSLQSSNGNRVAASFNAVELTGNVWFPSDGMNTIGTSSSNRPSSVFATQLFNVGGGGSFRFRLSGPFINSPQDSIIRFNNTLGIDFARATAIERLALGNYAGRITYDSDSNRLFLNNGSSWLPVALSTNNYFRSANPSGYASNINSLLGTNDWVTKKYADSVAAGAKDSLSRITAEVGTSDATPVSIGAIYVPSGSQATVNIGMQGVNQADNSIFSGQKTVTLKNLSGTLSLLGSVQTLAADQSESSLTGITWTISIVSNVAIIRVTGLAGTNIRWKATYNKIYQPLYFE